MGAQAEEAPGLKVVVSETGPILHLREARDASPAGTCPCAASASWRWRGGCLLRCGATSRTVCCPRTHCSLLRRSEHATQSTTGAWSVEGWSNRPRSSWAVHRPSWHGRALASVPARTCTVMFTVPASSRGKGSRGGICAGSRGPTVTGSINNEQQIGNCRSGIRRSADGSCSHAP